MTISMKVTCVIKKGKHFVAPFGCMHFMMGANLAKVEAQRSSVRGGGINKARKVTETRHLLMAWLGLACQLPCFTSFYSCSVNLVMVGICDIEIFIRLARQKACKIQGHYCSPPHIAVRCKQFIKFD